MAVGYGPVADWGTLVVETDVDRAFLQTLSLWMDTYLSQVERERELSNRSLARPGKGSYQNTLDETEFPDGKLPVVVVTTAQTTAVNYRQGGDVGADWTVNVSVIVRGRTAPETREVAALFGGCVKRILRDQQLPLEGEVRWASGRIIPVPDETDAGRWLAASVQSFTARIDSVITGEGPDYPDAPVYDPADPNDPDSPFDPPLTAETVTTTITPRS